MTTTLPGTLAATPLAWSLLLRASAVYFVLYTIPFWYNSFAVVTRFAWLPPFAEWYRTLWHPLTIWAGHTLLGFSESATLSPEAGGADGPYHWALLSVMLSVSLVIGATWTLLRRDGSDTGRLQAFLLTGFRYFVGVQLLEYGASKVMPTQFGPPNLIEMMTPLGELTPMGLLWNFMGFSLTYMRFTGLMEMLPGALLLFHGTAPLGALIAVGVLGNVFMLNVGFDVPVKLGSLHLLVMSFAVLAPQLPRLLRALTPESPEASETSWRAWAVPAVVLLVVGGMHLYWNLGYRRQWGDLAPPHAFHGLYGVDSASVVEGAPPPEWHDARIIVSERGRVALLAKGGTPVRGRVLRADTLRHTLVVVAAPRGGRLTADTMRYVTSGEQLRLEGSLDGREARVWLTRLPRPAFALTSQPFRWVNPR